MIRQRKSSSAYLTAAWVSMGCCSIAPPLKFKYAPIVCSTIANKDVAESKQQQKQGSLLQCLRTSTEILHMPLLFDCFRRVIGRCYSRELKHLGGRN